jgi:plasmid stabilization system protein ParE
LKIRFKSDATVELESALNWYAARSPDAEHAFAAAIDEALRQIIKTPNRFAAMPKGYRAYRLDRFPYQVVYRVEGGALEIVAVAHAKRRPGYWRRR